MNALQSLEQSLEASRRHAKSWWLLLPLALTGTVAAALHMLGRRESARTRTATRKQNLRWLAPLALAGTAAAALRVRKSRPS